MTRKMHFSCCSFLRCLVHFYTFLHQDGSCSLSARCHFDVSPSIDAPLWTKFNSNASNMLRYLGPDRTFMVTRGESVMSLVITGFWRGWHLWLWVRCLFNGWTDCREILKHDSVSFCMPNNHMTMLMEDFCKHQQMQLYWLKMFLVNSKMGSSRT